MMRKPRNEETADRLDSLTRNIIRLMREHRVSQSQISRDTGIDQPLISRLLSGANPRVTTIQTLAEYFDVGMDELLRRKRYDSRNV